MPAASIHIERFGGTRPRLDSRVLSDLESQIAENCRLSSGALGAWRKPVNAFPVGQNYLIWSNQFQQAGTWTQTGLVDVVPNATLAPDGSLTADKLRESAVTSTHRVAQTIAKTAVAEFWTAACSGKPAERNFMVLRMESVVDFAQVIINLTTGAVTSTTTSGAFSSATVQVDTEANGFFRAHLTAKTPATTGITFYTGISTDGTTVSYLGVLNSGIYVDGASLRRSNKPGPYRETLAAALPADPTSIYGFINTWFVANEVRHFARAPLPLDPVETTYFTRASGDPRVTYSPIAEDATGTGDLPRNSFSMGLPVPAAPAVSQNAVGGTITAASAIIGSVGGPIATQAYTLGPLAVDGSPVSVKLNTKASLATLNTSKATVVFSIRRTDFTQILARYEQTIEFDLDPVLGATVVVERDFDIIDNAASGSHTWEARIDVTPYSGTVTPTYQHGGGSIRYTKTLIASTAHGRVVGDLVSISGVAGMEAINTSEVQVIGVPGANSFYVDRDSLAQTYTAGGVWALVVDPENISDTAYVYTWLSTIGGKVLEGPPSPPSNIIARGDGQSIGISGIDIIQPVDGGSYLFSGKRIYRTNVRSDSGANYQFVAEIAVGQNSYTDTIRSISLGEVLPSTTWIKPPNDMHGLVEMTDGVLAGISGKQICFSEPYQPHAWPVGFRLNVFSDAVALIPFGASVAVLTLGKPHVINGTSPGQMEMTKIEAAQPCMSELSAVDMGSSGIYAGDDGLVMISTGGISVVTRDIMMKEEWRALNPASMRAAEYDDRYVCSFTRLDGTQGTFILDPSSPESTFTTMDVYFSALWTNPKNGNLFVLIDEYIAEFDASSNDWYDCRWRSKTYDTKTALNFALCKVEASDYPVNVDLYSNPDPAHIERAEGEGALVLMEALTVTDAMPIPLRGDYSGNLYEVEIRANGAGVVKRVSLATDIEHLNG